MFKKLAITVALATTLGLAAVSTSMAADIKIRATANSNENDEDFDGLVVFKNYVESASNGAIEVELFIGCLLYTSDAADE